MIGGAWHEVEGTTMPNGQILIRESTNDDEDRGYPTRFESWSWLAADRAAFDQRCGVSRTGVSGVVVTVTLDGEKL